MSGSTAAAVSGIVFRIGESAFFLPATVADKLLPMPMVARVPGGPPDLVGVALVEGETVPVVAVGDSDRIARARAALAATPGGQAAGGGAPSRTRDNLPMLVCTHLGERIALVGLDVIATGRFEAADGKVSWGAGKARPFDVGAVVARLREGRWAV